MTAPDRMCAPTSEPFSTTTTEMSDDSCFNLIAAARPGGPPPTPHPADPHRPRGGPLHHKSPCSRFAAGAVFPRLGACPNRGPRHCLIVFCYRALPPPPPACSERVGVKDLATS